MNRIVSVMVAASLLAGCASDGHRAPVQTNGSATAKPQAVDEHAKVHVVQKGDTLYGIAFSYGVDQHELAELNGIKNPNQIKVGQQIKLPSETASSEKIPTETPPAHAFVKDQPRVVKYAYSEAAVAKAEAVQGMPSRSEAQPEAKPEAKPETKVAKIEAKPEAKTEVPASTEDAIDWGMPAQGKLIGTFSEAENRKGIDIAGKLGQPVYASAPGKVVYSGSGLRGYGKLLIIKHNKTYLSAYAHNDKLLVKEGDTVKKGEKIAEMGKTDSDTVELHFEVRRLGKPVDPANYLHLEKP